jgi:ligand-binding sensor domain-containing protein
MDYPYTRRTSQTLHFSSDKVIQSSKADYRYCRNGVQNTPNGWEPALLLRFLCLFAANPFAFSGIGLEFFLHSWNHVQVHAPSRILIGVLALLSGLVALTASAARATVRADPHYIIDAWETDDGLPENSATAIVQTPDGYLWFGTFNGLVRFNGVQFTVFNPDNTPQLPDADIVNLHLDKSGRLWVSTYRGLVVYADGQWRQLTWINVESGDYARTFAERANGDLLITTFSGKLFEFSNGHVAELPPPPGEKGQGYFGGVDEDGRWWAVQHKFIGRWEKERWTPMISPPDVLGNAVGVEPARDGGMWLLLGKELRRLRRGTEVARVTLSEPRGGVWSLSEDSLGNVWIATFDQGVCRVSTNGTMVWWNATNGESDHGRCIFEDREKNLWVGTSGDGLRRFTSRRIQHLAPEGGRKGLQVQSVWPDDHGGAWGAPTVAGCSTLARPG